MSGTAGHVGKSDAAPAIIDLRELARQGDDPAEAPSTGGEDVLRRRRTVHAFGAGPRDDHGNAPQLLTREIHEQPDAVRRTLAGRIDMASATPRLPGLDLLPPEIQRAQRVKILGCGSSYYSAMAGALLIEQLARISADAEPSSEFRYRNPIIDPDTIYLVVTQSGETVDTLRVVDDIKQRGGRVFAVVNVEDSSVVQACDGVVYLRAGPEASVTASKTFTSSYVALALIALHLARVRGMVAEEGIRLLAGLEALPTTLEEALETDDRVQVLGAELAGATSAFYVGEVNGYPIALEGAQKVKELAYIHAEAFPSAELRYGPLALVTPGFPTVAILPNDGLLPANLATVKTIRAHRGVVLAVGHSELLRRNVEHLVLVPKTEPELDPVVLNVPLQLLAYHAAAALGLDVDRPRSLVKSVTVD